MKKILLPLLSALFFSGSANAQCPGAPENPTYLVTENNSASFNVGNNQVLYLSSGTYTGVIGGVAAGGTIQIGENAVFSPASISNFAGEIINCGTASMPSLRFDSPSEASLFNYGKMELKGTYNFNQPSFWNNGNNAEMSFASSLMMNSVTFINNGKVTIQGNFTVNSGLNNLKNEGSILASGDILLNASINNLGLIRSLGGNVVMNSAGRIMSSCIISAKNRFNYSGIDTLFNDGLILVSGGDFLLQGVALKGLQNSFIQGVNFQNNGTKVSGRGNYYFTGTTVNQGSTSFGADGMGINFYDVSHTGSAAKIFDNQISAPHSSVTRNPINPWDTTRIPSGCSAVYRAMGCNLAENIMITGDTVCSNSTNAMVRVSGTVTGHIYQVFKGELAIGSPVTSTGGDLMLSVPAGSLQTGVNEVSVRISSPGCGTFDPGDRTVILLNQIPDAGTIVNGSKVCSDEQTAPVIITNAQSGVRYQAFSGSLAVGQPVVANGPSVVLTVPLQDLTGNTVSVEAKISGCAAVRLSDTANITVLPVPDIFPVAITGDTVCSNQQSASVLLSGTQQGITYNIYKGNVLLASAVAQSGTVQLTVPVSDLTSGNNELTLKYVIQACRTFNSSQEFTVLVLPQPSISFEADGSVLANNSDSAFVTVLPYQPGVVYSIIRNGTEIGSEKVVSGDEITLIFPVNKPESEDFIVVVKGFLTTPCGIVNYSDTALIKASGVISSLKDQNKQASFRIWPNPSSGDVNVDAAEPFTSVEIKDMTGQVIRKANIVPSSSYTLDSRLPKGVYYVSISGTDFQSSSMIIIE